MLKAQDIKIKIYIAYYSRIVLFIYELDSQSRIVSRGTRSHQTEDGDSFIDSVLVCTPCLFCLLTATGCSRYHGVGGFCVLLGFQEPRLKGQGLLDILESQT